MTKYERVDLHPLNRWDWASSYFPCVSPRIWNLPVSARFSLKMMGFARLNRFRAIINLNRLETHGIPSILSLIKSKAIFLIVDFERSRLVELEGLCRGLVVIAIQTDLGLAYG